jgi:hypothetical protein
MKDSGIYKSLFSLYKKSKISFFFGTLNFIGNTLQLF